jgi:hypothetical protein
MVSDIGIFVFEGAQELSLDSFDLLAPSGRQLTRLAVFEVLHIDGEDVED